MRTLALCDFAGCGSQGCTSQWSGYFCGKLTGQIRSEKLGKTSRLLSFRKAHPFANCAKGWGTGKTDTAMTNETLCKILCHNLVVLIHEMYELGIDPVFWNQPSVN